MKLVTCRHRERVVVGVWEDERLLLPALASARDAPGDMLALIDAGPDALARLRDFVAARAAEIEVAHDAVEWLAPIPRPRRNVLCLGWNYLEHARETDAARSTLPRPAPETLTPKTPPPKAPIVFTKAASCVCGPFAEIPLDPAISEKLDWEVELGVVVGRAGHKLSRNEAPAHVFGYTVVNDISARDLQKLHRQFYLGKSLPRSCPTGPCLVTADEIPDPQNLQLTCRVNGEVKQQANTAEQIFDVASVIATLSKSPDVEPGDIIATGTPAGVGFARKPPEYLRPGDVVECEIERIGKLVNPVVAA